MTEYNKILGDLRGKRKALVAQLQRLDALIQGLEEFSRDTRPNGSVIGSLETTELPYRGLTVLEAARKCLKSHGKPMNTHEICTELLDGGLKSTAKKFSTTVYSTLFRDDDFISNEGMWSLKSEC